VVELERIVVAFNRFGDPCRAVPPDPRPARGPYVDHEVDDPLQPLSTESEQLLGEWSIRCADLQGRARDIVVRARADATVTLQLPAGESATLNTASWLHLREVLDEARTSIPPPVRYQ
jgi:hypothetical protein